MIYPLEPADRETTVDLAHDNPMPRGLREQIANWIEPQTMNYEIDHAAVMDCIRIAYPLIRAYLAEHPEAVRA